MATWNDHKSPANWIPDWSENATDVTFPIASIPKLDAAEADGTTGDMRRVLYALLEQVYATWLTIPTAERPANMRIYRSTSVNDQTGVTTKTFQVQLQVSNTDEEVIDEESES